MVRSVGPLSSCRPPMSVSGVRRDKAAFSSRCKSHPASRQGRPSFILTETEQALRIEVRDLLLIIHVDGHLIKALPSGFHAPVWLVRGEHDAVDTDRVHHALIGLVRQTPALIHRARLLVYVLTSEDSTVEVLPKVFLDGPFQPTHL